MKPTNSQRIPRESNGHSNLWSPNSCARIDLKGARKHYKRQKVRFLRVLLIIREYLEINLATAIEQNSGVNADLDRVDCLSFTQFGHRDLVSDRIVDDLIHESTDQQEPSSRNTM